MPARRPHTLTIKRLREVLDYDPDTGIFRWKVTLSNRAPAGSEAGGPKGSDQHGTIRVDGRAFQATTLAWASMTGEFPALLVDHRDGDAGNDRFANLRLATYGQNAMNAGAHKDNISGFKGVHLHKATGRWCAQLRAGGKRRHLGLFDRPEQAHAAYVAAAAEAVGEFARGG